MSSVESHPSEATPPLDADKAIAALLASLDSASLKKLLSTLPTTVSGDSATSPPKKHLYPRPEPDYVVQVVSFCSMCDSIIEKNIQMTWDAENRLFRASKHPPVLARNTIRKLHKIPVQSCGDCRTRLSLLDKEDLIQKLLSTNESLEKVTLLALKTKEIETTERPAIQLDFIFN